MATRSKRIGGRTKSAGDSKQQGGGVRGSKNSNLKRPGNRIGHNERVSGEKLLAKEKAGKKLGPNERATIKSYKSKLATKPKATTTDKPKTTKPKATTTDKSKTTKSKEKNKEALKFKGKVKDFNTKPGLMDAVKKSKEKPEAEKKVTKSNVFTRHYKTGKPLGVLTGSQRRNYDKEAAGRTFEGQVAKYEKESGHGKSHKRETLYKAAMRKRKNKK